MILTDEDFVAYLGASPLQVRKLRNEISKMPCSADEVAPLPSPAAPVMAAGFVQNSVGGVVPVAIVLADSFGNQGMYLSLPKSLTGLQIPKIIIYSFVVRFFLHFLSFVSLKNRKKIRRTLLMFLSPYADILEHSLLWHAGIRFDNIRCLVLMYRYVCIWIEPVLDHCCGCRNPHFSPRESLSCF